VGKKITIYMIDGTPEGAKTFEIGNWSGKAISCPRSNAKNILERAEFENSEVYILRSTASTWCPVTRPNTLVRWEWYYL